MLVARVLVGLCMGGIWAIAGGLAARLVPASSIGLAASIIFGGVATASVLGVPLGAWIGDALGWRWSFGCMAVLSAAVLLLQLVAMPPLAANNVATVRHFAKLLTVRPFQVGLCLTLLLVAGHFAALTFVQSLLLSISGFKMQWISGLLLAYGLSGIAGNFLASTVAARHTLLILGVIALGLFMVPLMFLAIGDTLVGGGSVLLIWGLAYGGVSVGLMTWMMKVAPQTLEVATALYVAVFNIGIALGAWVEGQLVDDLGLRANLWLAATLAAAAAAALLVLSMRRWTRPPAVARKNIAA